MRTLLKLFISFICAVNILVRWSWAADTNTDGPDSPNGKRIYFMKRVNGAGCPYTASWLSHVNLYRRIVWYTDSTKMEAASFQIFDRARFKFQISDADAYYVHHMSMFEHLIHKREGFMAARNKTDIMSRAAMNGECEGLKVNPTKEYLALVPFFGGLPPNVAPDFSTVKSIGQGNSLVGPRTKALWCMATVCSCLKYFGHVVLGVVRDIDRELLLKVIKVLKPEISRRIQLVQLSMTRNANLPFHLLSWGQHYVKQHNCKNFDDNSKDKTSDGLMQICSQGGIAPHRGANYNVTYHHTSELHGGDTPIRYVYYSEMDQIVRFDSFNTYRALSAASNETTFYVGRRREKQQTSDPSEYMGSLSAWRECGREVYSLNWPEDNVVRAAG